MSDTSNDHITTLKQLQGGSYKAFEILYKQYFDLLYGFIFSLTRSHESTEEIVQETFIKVWINHRKINPAFSFKAWLYRMAHNQLLDQLRKQFHSPLFEDYLNHCTNEDLSVESDEGSFDFEAFRRSLNAAKGKLSPRQAEVFERSKEQGFTTGEIAKQLNISEQAVYNYLSQALTILRNELSSLHFLLLLFLLL
ncbi:MAG: sigma-70 family RNA polymerase sigma factor [Tannerellaceae bacterium]|jgi:RNA polymerase sigma-70 factor (ECF subfamily)|nr:sigma-70 family RNA polymerase sigma factor [Tannerellaceae bacterium]